MSKMYTDVAVFIAACEQEKTEGNASLYRNLIAEEFNELNKQIRAIGATLYALTTAMRKKLQNEKNSK